MMSTHCLPEENRRCHLSPAIAFVLSFIFVLALCLTARPAHAQVLYGTLTGNVTDPSGAVLPGAKVHVVNLGTGIAAEQTTGRDGVYRFTDLLAGQYKVTISADKFAPAVFESIGIEVSTVRRIDASLKVGTEATNVTVTTEPPVLQTDQADVHTDISAREVEGLPDMGSQGRNFQSLLKLIPGAGLVAETNSLSGNPQRAINTNVNGQSNQSVNTRIDGAQDLYPWLPANVAYVPPADSIQEVHVVTNSFDAEQGMAGGAAVNVQIKSGTNSYHGTADWFHTDQNFAAKNYFSTSQPLNRNNQNQFGGTFGGPIRHDKLFFFGDYERTTQRQKAGPDNRTLPIAQMVQGDFRGLTYVDSSSKATVPVGIYDPATGLANGTGKQIISCNGVQNVICPNRIDPASAAMIKLLAPSLAQLTPQATNMGNFFGSGTALFNRDNADIKVNYVPTDKSTLFGRYSLSRSLVFDPPLFGDAGGDATNGGQLGNAPGLVQSVGLGATHTFSPTMLLDWNFGYTRQRLGATFDLGSPRGLNDLKIPGTNGAGVPGNTGAAGDLYNGLPSFQLFLTPGGSTTNFGNPNTGNPFLFRDDQFVSGANLTWIRGRHSLRGGVEWNHTLLNHFQPQGGTFQTPRGTFQFTGNVTSQGGVAAPSDSWFNAWADFLLGLPTQTGKASQLFNPIALRWSQWASYVQDRWQVGQRLTLTLGVRWEYYPFGYSDHDTGLRWLNPATGNVLIGGNGSVPKDDTIDVGSGQFLPRIGVAYRLGENTAIRAGYGMSADPNNWRYFRNAYPSALIVSNTLASSSTFIPMASLTGLNGTGLGSGSYSVPAGITLLPVPDLSSGVIPLPTNASTTTIPNPFHRGYNNSYNFMLEQEWAGFVLETGYVGSYMVRPLVNMNLNAGPPGPSCLSPAPTCGGANGGLISNALGKTYTGTINGLVPFKNSRYDSLQTKLTRRFKQGTTAGFVWTWSKAMDYEDNEELNSLAFPFPSVWQKNYAPAGFDRTDNVKIYGLFRLPFGKGQEWMQSGIGNWLLGGWQFSPVVSYLTGLPFTVNASGSSLNANGSQQTANQVGSFRYIGGTPLPSGSSCPNFSCNFFDPTAFAAPTGAVYGNTNRNQFRGPSYFEMDASLSREFRMTERFGLQLRADAFSLTNTPHFANPNSTCCGTTFGRITSTLSPGGFFGPDPGTRSLWLGARLTF